jgi:hypothetical protein
MESWKSRKPKIHHTNTNQPQPHNRLTNTWGFKISPNKIVAILFSPQYKRVPAYPKLYLQNELIKFTTHTSFLGATLDKKSYLETAHTKI